MAGSGEVPSGQGGMERKYPGASDQLTSASGCSHSDADVNARFADAEGGGYFEVLAAIFLTMARTSLRSLSFRLTE